MKTFFKNRGISIEPFKTREHPGDILLHGDLVERVGGAEDVMVVKHIARVRPLDLHGLFNQGHGFITFH